MLPIRLRIRRAACHELQSLRTAAREILGLRMQDDATRLATAAQASRINNPRCVHVTPPGPSRATPDPTLITRDAVSHLMHLRGLSTIPQNPFLLDVRRRDEVTLFGSFPEAKHVPLLDLIFALAAPSEHEFEDVTGFERPERGQLLVFCSRVRKRAELAACVALDHGTCCTWFERALRCCQRQLRPLERCTKSFGRSVSVVALECRAGGCDLSKKSTCGHSQGKHVLLMYELTTRTSKARLTGPSG